MRAAVNPRSSISGGCIRSEEIAKFGGGGGDQFPAFLKPIQVCERRVHFHAVDRHAHCRQHLASGILKFASDPPALIILGPDQQAGKRAQRCVAQLEFRGAFANLVLESRLRVAKLLFGQFAAPQVLADPDDSAQSSEFVEQWRKCDQGRKKLAVFAADLKFARPTVDQAQLFQWFFGFRLRPGADGYFQDVRADHFVRGPSVELFGEGIPVSDRARLSVMMIAASNSVQIRDCETNPCGRPNFAASETAVEPPEVPDEPRVLAEAVGSAIRL